jgi:hypothetical protein
MRHLLALTICFLVVAAAAVPAGAQTGFDRPGGDYSSFTVLGGDPAVCAARCERESRCRAWSFRYPGPGNAFPTCWLKNHVMPRVENNCCVSGVRGAGVVERRTNEAEFAIDRYGGDYRNFEVPTDPSGKTCQAACQADNRCRAWTYVRPGYIASPARCYLKDRITPPRRQPCCISGVVR